MIRLEVWLSKEEVDHFKIACSEAVEDQILPKDKRNFKNMFEAFVYSYRFHGWESEFEKLIIAFGDRNEN